MFKSGLVTVLFIVERLFPQALDTFGQQRHYLVHIADDTQVGYAEYGSKLIFVDGNDIFALPICRTPRTARDARSYPSAPPEHSGL